MGVGLGVEEVESVFFLFLKVYVRPRRFNEDGGGAFA